MRSDDDDYGMGRQFADRDVREGDSTYLKVPDGASFLKFESAKKAAMIDIIPYKVGKGNPNADKGKKYIERTFFIHRNLGPNKATHICLAKTFNKKCPVCEFAQKLWDSGEESEIEVAKSLKPSKRQLWNVVDAKNKDDGVQLLDQSAFFFGDQVKLAIDALPEGDEKEKFASPTEGFTLQVQIAKEDFQGRPVYKPKRIDFVKRTKQYKPSIVKETYCLDDLLKPLSYDELKRILHQTSEEDESDSGSRKKGKKMKRKAVTATSKKIKKGSVVLHDDLGKCKVKSVSRDGFTLVLVDEDKDEHKGVGVAEVELAGAASSKKGSKAKSTTKASSKKSKKAVEDDDEDEDEDDEDEDFDEDEDSDDEDEDEDDEDEDDDSNEDDDEEDEDEDDDDEDEDEEDEDEEDEDEDDEPAPKKRGKGKRGRK